MAERGFGELQVCQPDLSGQGKVTEQVTLTAIMWPMQDNQGIRPSQLGFMRGRCCLTNLTSSRDRVTHWEEEGKAVGMFSWAFLLSPVSSDRLRGNGLELHQGRFRLHVRKTCFTERVTKHWNRLLVEVVELPSLEMFKVLVNVAPGDTV